jgi:hypothetical protein
MLDCGSSVASARKFLRYTFWLHSTGYLVQCLPLGKQDMVGRWFCNSLVRQVVQGTRRRLCGCTKRFSGTAIYPSSSHIITRILLSTTRAFPLSPLNFPVIPNYLRYSHQCIGSLTLAGRVRPCFPQPRGRDPLESGEIAYRLIHLVSFQTRRATPYNSASTTTNLQTPRQRIRKPHDIKGCLSSEQDSRKMLIRSSRVTLSCLSPYLSHYSCEGQLDICPLRPQSSK